MKKINFLDFLYILAVTIIFIINLSVLKKELLVSVGNLVIICLLAIYPFIRRKLLIKSSNCTVEDISMELERLQLLQLKNVRRTKQLEVSETQLYSEKQEFEKEKKLTKETIKFIEDELFKISDEMPGESYEKFVGFCLMTRGWKNIAYTKRVGDYGADIIAKNPYGLKTCVQCKRYSSGKVGIDAVQQVYSSEKYYNCTCGVVITNSKFTKSARKLAEKTGVILIEDFPRKENEFFNMEAF